MSSFYVRDRLRSMRHSLTVWNAGFIWLMQGLSDASHWPKVKATGNATAAALFALVGPRLAHGVGIPANVQARPVRRAAVAAIATAAATWEEVSVVRRVTGIGNRINRGARNVVSRIETFFRNTRRNAVYLQGGPLHFLAANSVSRRSSQRMNFSFIRQASGNSLSFLATAFRRPFIRPTTSNTVGSISTGRIWRPLQLWPQSRRRFQLSLPYSM